MNGMQLPKIRSSNLGQLGQIGMTVDKSSNSIALDQWFKNKFSRFILASTGS
jgi:hypothetical protein